MMTRKMATLTALAMAVPLLFTSMGHANSTTDFGTFKVTCESSAVNQVLQESLAELAEAKATIQNMFQNSDEGVTWGLLTKTTYKEMASSEGIVSSFKVKDGVIAIKAELQVLNRRNPNYSNWVLTRANLPPTQTSKQILLQGDCVIQQ